MNARARWSAVVVCGLFLAAAAAPLSAQLVGSASRWTSFVGCWEPTGAEEDPGLLCFRLSGDGVEMTNVFEGEVTAREVVVADGVARPVDADGCQGTESAEFSRDGRRVFTSSAFLCDGERRVGSGVMSFISPTQWIDVRSLTIEGEPVVWAQRYSAATAETLAAHVVDDPAATDRTTVRARRLLASRDILVEDVEEAIDRIDPEAVRIWLATNDSDFALDGSKLVELADAGVPDDVIDVMVAVSFPEKFSVTPEGVPREVMQRVGTDVYRSGSRVGYRTLLWDPYYYPRVRYGYSPFGYYGYSYGLGYYGGYDGYVPASIVVAPREGTYTGSARGRMVRGQGYTRSSSGGGSSSGTSRSSGSSGGSSGSSSSGGSANSGSASSGGSGGSSSSGGSSTPRTAVPRTAVPR